MAPSISFYAGPNNINNLSGSGLGGYGTSFGATVPVGSWQNRTFVTDVTGANQGPEANNVQYVNAGSGVLGNAGSGISLTAMPNYQSTLGVRFTNSSPVRLVNSQVRAYDGVSINNNPSGLTVAVAECIHPSITQTNNGSGSASWSFLGGSGTVLNLGQSPGTSGLQNSPVSVYVDNQHDYYLNISLSPSSIGSKAAMLYFYTEYL